MQSDHAEEGTQDSDVMLHWQFLGEDGGVGCWFVRMYKNNYTELWINITGSCYRNYSLDIFFFHFGTIEIKCIWGKTVTPKSFQQIEIKRFIQIFIACNIPTTCILNAVKICIYQLLRKRKHSLGNILTCSWS